MESNLTATQLNFRYAWLADEIENKIMGKFGGGC